MPPIPEIKTVRDIIFYQYAKIIAASAFHCSNSKEAKKKHFGFIRKTVGELIKSDKKWSDILREDFQFVESEKVCIYCGSDKNIEKEHIVPKSIKIKDDCKTCEKILGIHNYVWACKNCNGGGGKGAKGLYTFYKEKYPDESAYYDIIPALVEKKYLKTIYHCHVCSGTIDSSDIDGDNDITVLDIDFIINKKF